MAQAGGYAADAGKDRADRDEDVAEEAIARNRRPRALSPGDPAESPRRVNGAADQKDDGVEIDEGAEPEIGRASCRERG